MLSSTASQLFLVRADFAVLHIKHDWEISPPPLFFARPPSFCSCSSSKANNMSLKADSAVVWSIINGKKGRDLTVFDALLTVQYCRRAVKVDYDTISQSRDQTVRRTGRTCRDVTWKIQNVVYSLRFTTSRHWKNKEVGSVDQAITLISRIKSLLLLISGVAMFCILYHCGVSSLKVGYLLRV